MDEKWRLALWAAAAGKDMEFAATQRSASLFCRRRLSLLRQAEGPVAKCSFQAQAGKLYIKKVIDNLSM